MKLKMIVLAAGALLASAGIASAAAVNNSPAYTTAGYSVPGNPGRGFHGVRNYAGPYAYGRGYGRFGHFGSFRDGRFGGFRGGHFHSGGYGRY